MTTPQDVERLSTYLDHQLSPAEKSKLEARLKREPELQAALADLRATVRLLRGLPTIKPPRNFTLSSNQVSKLSQRQPIFLKLRLATTLAALVLAAVVGGDLFSSLSLGFGGAAAPAPQVAAEKTEPTTAGAGLSAAQDNLAATEAPTAEATLETPLPDAGAIETNTPEAVFSVPAATQASTDERTFASTIALTQTPTAAPTSRPGGAAELNTQAPLMEVPTEPAMAMPAATASPWPLVRYAEVGLVLLTALLAGATWLTRKG